MLRSSGASQRPRLSTASKIGSRTWFIHCHSTATLRHFRRMALRGVRKPRPSVPEEQLLTTQQKVTFLAPMLGQIANYFPVISRTTLVKNLTSIQSVSNTIREHFGFQVTGAHFLDSANLHLETEKRPRISFRD